MLTRQGVGAFVANVARRPFRIDLDGLHSLREVLDVMELRTGMEVEAAGLAAERATPVQIHKIDDAYAAIDRAIARGKSAVDEDFAFHCSIADAAGNPQFLRFLDYLGRHIIPRQSIRVSAPQMTDSGAYLRTIQKEHRDILDAIQASAPTKARAAMRRHLLKAARAIKTRVRTRQGITRRADDPTKQRSIHANRPSHRRAGGVGARLRKLSRARIHRSAGVISAFPPISHAMRRFSPPTLQTQEKSTR